MSPGSVRRNTPIEEYEGIYVKREDLCVPKGAPPFSKIRGLVKHLERLKQEGYIGAAYVETSVSMAGWGVAWACYHLGMKCLIFNPIYKDTPPLLQFHREQWERWGAELKEVPAGRAKVNYYIARKQIPKGFKLLPLGLPLPETITETARIAASCINPYKSIVVSVGSGTVAAGIYQATSPKQTLYGIMSRSGDAKKKRKHVKEGGPLFSFESRGTLQIIDMGWEYANSSKIKTPFPCHPWYDAKAWEWLIHNKENLSAPILFWNIGSTGEFQ